MGSVDDLNVLVAEDNDMNWAVMNGTLAKWGPSVDRAENGQEALDAVTKNRYDVVFMDIDMPVMDGYDATQAIADALGDDRPRIYAVTANMVAEDHAKERGIPFDGYMVKPIQPDQLHAWLEVAAGERQIVETETESGSDNGQTDSLTRILDMSVLDGMVDQIGAEVARSMLEEFSNSAPGIRTTLTEALRSGDAHAAGKAAHQLKSMAGYIGAMDLQRRCMEIDEPDFDAVNDATASEVDAMITAVLADVDALGSSGWPDT